MQKHFSNIFGTLALVALLASACRSTVPVTGTQKPSLVPATLTPDPALPPELLWTFQTGAAIWGTPAVSDNTVFIGSDDGNLYAIEAQTGNLKWKFTTQGIVRSQPAVAQGRVYIASDDGNLYAIDIQAGTEAWRADIGNYLARDARVTLGLSTAPTGYDYKQSSPLVTNGQIYIGSLDGNVYSLAVDTGLVTWKTQTGGRVRATVAVNNGNLYVGSWDESMYALDALTGRVLWNTPVGGEVQSTALIANGLVYTASRKGSVVALDVQTGEKKWEYDYAPNMWVESSPQLVGNILYIGSSGYQPIYGLNGQTGEVITLFGYEAFYWSTPAIVGDFLYIGAVSFKSDPVNKGGLAALKFSDGKIVAPELWTYPVPDLEKAEGNWRGVASSPVVVNGIIYFGGLDGVVYAVAAAVE